MDELDPKVSQSAGKVLIWNQKIGPNFAIALECPLKL
jgi:hypothetical protein